MNTKLIVICILIFGSLLSVQFFCDSSSSPSPEPMQTPTPPTPTPPTPTPPTPTPPTPKLDDPVFDLAEGTYFSEQTLSITCSDTAVIIYTTDGSTPSLYNGEIYIGPIEITETTTVKAMGIADGYEDSDVVTKTYTLALWKSVSSPTNDDMYGIDLVDINNGWAIGKGTTFAELWKLDNGTWEDAFLDTPSSTQTMYDIDIVSMNSGNAVGTNGTIWDLTLGSWSSVGGTPSDKSIRDLDLVGGCDGRAVGYDSTTNKAFVATFDSCSWTYNDYEPQGSFNEEYWYGISLVDADNGFAVGYGTITSDWVSAAELEAGTWKTVSMTGSGALYAVEIVDMENGWAVGSNGNLYQLSSGSWSNTYDNPTTDTMWSIDIIDMDTGWAVGEGGALWKLEDGEWESVSGPSSDNMYAVSITSLTRGWAVGADGTLWELSTD